LNDFAVFIEDLFRAGAMPCAANTAAPIPADCKNVRRVGWLASLGVSASGLDANRSAFVMLFWCVTAGWSF